ncbi:hypothetical protein DSO57_1023772 [Entomophthora muscae]|uniref:Uncharacterized protein n=1 Tax=Entomophthora muscae TaxID=34485 RepID=A0ACC2T2W4_9FUNG|nr:hypothetical protein DSO57_1023772 [Entomophthora muscae]
MQSTRVGIMPPSPNCLTRVEWRLVFNKKEAALITSFSFHLLVSIHKLPEKIRHPCPRLKIKTPPPVKIRAVLEARIGEWQVVPKSSEESKPAEEPEDENVPFDEDDLSTFRLG